VAITLIYQQEYFTAELMGSARETQIGRAGTPCEMRDNLDERS